MPMTRWRPHVVVRIHSGGNGSEGPYVEIIDDGHGMDYGTIRDVWCVIATPVQTEAIRLEDR